MYGIWRPIPQLIMNPLRETFCYLFASRLKRSDPHAAFRAVLGTIILAFLNLLTVGTLLEPTLGFVAWYSSHGWPSIIAIFVALVAIATVQYLCWIANGRLDHVRAAIKDGRSMSSAWVFGYIAVSILAIPVTGVLMHQLRS
jgi:hypothetical protein